MVMNAPSRLKRKGPTRLASLAALTIAGLAVRPAQADHPNALWRVVHDLCVPNKTITGFAAPCLDVNLKGGFAIVPDLTVPAQLIIVPTRRLTGIEDPRILAPKTPNYWQAAWDARGLLAKRLGRPIPRDDIGMAINAIQGRSQGQLHIHLSCVRSDVAATLRRRQGAVSPRWATIAIGRRRWRVRALSGDDLGSRDPFKLLVAASPSLATDMGSQTLVVVGRTLKDGKAGFFLLSRTADPLTGDYGHGEYLLDKSCRAAAAP
jgi:CDP-diacylglycerol pyrophosphatase